MDEDFIFLYCIVNILPGVNVVNVLFILVSKIINNIYANNHVCDYGDYYPVHDPVPVSQHYLEYI